MAWIAPPGALVDTGSGRLHAYSAGAGKPVVVLEAGIAASSVSWSLVQPRVAEWTRVVSYDRAGFGWSEEGGGPTAMDAAYGLKGLLEVMAITDPVVLVGHSFGGLIVRLFQQQWPERVAGMVLVDPVIREEWREADDARPRMLGRGVMLSRRGALLARLGVVRLALKLLVSGSHRVPQLMAKASAGRGAGVANRLVGEVRKMPREWWPAVAQHWSEARSFRAMAENLESLPVSVRQLDEERSLGDLPTVVLSARQKVAEHAHDARLSTRGQHVVVEASGHWMQLDSPDAVVQAIEDVTAMVRKP